MKKYSIILSTIVCFLLFCTQTLIAQNTYKLNGKVFASDTGDPLENAVISIPGSSVEAVQTDASGAFTIDVPAELTDVECWASGYYTAKQSVVGKKYVEFDLISEKTFNYTENFQRPFRNDKLSNKSTAVNSIGKTGFGEGSVTIEQAIYNALPGLRNIDKSGMPGEGAYSNARGINSFIGNSAPLIVINNVPYIPDMNNSYVVEGYSNSVLNAISPNDIQNITYLRGADAAAYGSLGSSGVILIETENAVDLETVVEFTGQYGMAYNVSTLPTMGASDYKNYLGGIALTKYTDPSQVVDIFPFLKDDPSYYYNYLYNNNTDWQDKIYSPAFVTDNQLKVKGGDAIALYNISLGYLNQDGILKNTNFTRYKMHLNSNINISKKLQAFTTMSMSYMNNKLQEQGMVKQTNPILASLAKSPMINPYEKDKFGNQLPRYSTVRDENGIYENDGVSNPLAIVEETGIESQMYDIMISGGLNYNLNQNWKFTGQVGFFYNYNRADYFMPGVTIKSFMPLSDGLAYNTVRMGIQESFNMYYNLNTAWNKKINKIHDVSASIGWQAMTTHREYDSGEGRNTASDFYTNLKDVDASGRQFYGYINKWNWMNFYAYGSYTYNDLVSAGVTMSYDGASSVGPDANRFAFYPGVNAALHAKSLGFLKDVYAINKLTLRAEYTMTGNSAYSSMLSQYYYQNQTFQTLSGIVRSNIPNTYIEPEKTTSANVGLDFSAFKNALGFSVDFYTNKTTDVILDRVISPAFGTASTYDNTAEIQNRGFEVGLQGYVLRNRDFSWLLGGTFAMNKNEILSMGSVGDKIIEFEDGSALISRKGQSAYSFYGYKTDGIYASQADADAAGLTNYAGVPFNAGDVKFVNMTEGDSFINADDRVILGDANPDFFGRFYTSIGFKKFVLTANFSYSYGNDAYNAVRREFESMDNFDNQLTSANRRWAYDGHVTDMPRAVYGDPMQNNRFSDRFIEDASYIKLKELTLSYNFGEDFIKFLRGGTFYVTGENLFTITKYLGLDPEFSYSYSSMMQGFDYGKVPHPLNVKFGVKLQF